MSRNTKVVTKKSKKSVKKIITEMDIIDGINKNDLTGLVNENNLDVVIELYKKVGHYINAVTISHAITNDICAEKFYNFVKNYNDNDIMLLEKSFNDIVLCHDSFGGNIISDNAYSLFVIDKFLAVNSLNELIVCFTNYGIPKIDILNFLKKNFFDQLYNLANNASYEKTYIMSSISDGTIDSAFRVRYDTAVILRMFNANPK